MPSETRAVRGIRGRAAAEHGRVAGAASAPARMHLSELHLHCYVSIGVWPIFVCTAEPQVERVASHLEVLRRVLAGVPDGHALRSGLDAAYLGWEGLLHRKIILAYNEPVHCLRA
jgi:hypothetical protein